jgi:hypothetical protein
MSRGCRKARKEIMLRIWRIEQSLKQRPDVAWPRRHARKGKAARKP